MGGLVPSMAVLCCAARPPAPRRASLPCASTACPSRPLQAPLAQVAADLELSSLDKRQMPLSYHLLPNPPVLRLLQRAEGALADRCVAAALVLRRDLFAAATPGCGAAAAPAVVPGPAFRRILPRLQADVDSLLASLDGLVEACSGGVGCCWGAGGVGSAASSPTPLHHWHCWPR